MANFKGGFAFNNGPAKVVVEQAPDGTLVSCVNPVTGQGLNAGNYSETYEGTAAEIVIETEALLPNLVREGNASIYFTFDMTALGIPVPITVMVNRAVGMHLYCDNINYTESGLSGMYAEMEFSQGQHIIAAELLSITNGVITDGSAYASSVPTVMKVNYHTMPE